MFKDDVDGADVNPARVYVAICAAPLFHEAPAARGVFPLLVESMMLWRYTVRHGHLPMLNSSGSGHAPPPCPDFDLALLATVIEAIHRDDAAARLLHGLAASMGYAPTRRTRSWKEADLVGVERHLGGAYWLQLGWTPEKRGARFWIEDKGTANGNWFGDGADEGVAGTATELQARIRLLWTRWYTER